VILWPENSHSGSWCRCLRGIGRTPRYYSSLKSFVEASSEETTWKATAWFLGDEELEARLIAACTASAKDIQTIHEYGIKFYRLKRATKKGTTQLWPLPDQTFEPVSTTLMVLEEDPPDQSWMSEPPNLLEPVSWLCTYNT
jgi:hypothetical protein